MILLIRHVLLISITTTTLGIDSITSEAVKLVFDSNLNAVRLTDANAREDIRIYTVDGIVVAHASSANSVDTSALTSGIYVARSSTAVLKFVK